jgi:hypothetical protein
MHRKSRAPHCRVHLSDGQSHLIALPTEQVKEAVHAALTTNSTFVLFDGSEWVYPGFWGGTCSFDRPLSVTAAHIVRIADWPY